MKRKICMVSPLDYTGIAYYSYSLCQSLALNGVDITLITVNNPPIGLPGACFKKKEFFCCTYGSRPLFVKALAYFYAMVKTLIYVLFTRQSIVHCQILDFPEVDILFFLSLKLFRKKIIFTPHDVRSLKKDRYNILLKILYRLSDFLIVHNDVNKLVMKEMIPWKEKKIEIIPHGNYKYFLSGVSKEEARLKLGLPLDKRLILLFGNIRPGKGIEKSVEAFKKIDRDDCALLIVGKAAKNYDFNNLVNLIKRNGLVERVLLINKFVENDMVEFYYKATDVLLVPYEFASASGVLHYAFSCGCVIIVSDLKEFSEDAIDEVNCLVFQRGNSKELAEKISYLLEHHDFARHIGEEAKIMSERKYDWNIIAKKTEMLYEFIQTR